MHNKSKLAREIIEAERHPPHRKPPAKPREKIVEEAGQHLRTLHSQAPSGTREWNIASVDYRLQSLDRQTLGKIRERNIAAANAHFAFPLSFAGPYSGVGDEEVTDYDIASVFGEESNPVSVGKALAQYAEKSDQGKVTSIFTEAQAPKVIRFDHAAVNAALMAAAKKRRHAQKHREAERRRAEKCPDDEPDVMTLMEGHPAKEETPDRLGFSVDEPDTIAMAEERLVEEPVDNDKADEQPLSPPPTLPFLKGPKKRRDAPMSRAEEAEAVTLAYAGDKEAQRKLVSCNEGLVRKKAGEFFANYQGFTFAELVEVGRC